MIKLVSLSIALSLLVLWALGCGGGGTANQGPTTPSGNTGGHVSATITLTASELVGIGANDPALPEPGYLH